MLSDPLFFQALAAVWGLALLTGPLGCFVLWHRMAYFGDAVAHAALLGVAMGLVAGIGGTAGIFLSSLLMALLLSRLQAQRYLASDALLGILAHGALAAGLVLVALLGPGMAGRVNAALFGDILAIDEADVAAIYACALVALFLLFRCWRPLLKFTLHEEIASVEGVASRHMRLLLVALIALAVAVAVNIVGMLLVTAMLIIPAAVARYFAATPTQMAVGAALAGMVASAAGLMGAFAWDTPAGPSIILAALLLFAVCQAAGKITGRSPR